MMKYTEEESPNRWLSHKVHHWATVLQFLPTIWFVQYMLGPKNVSSLIRSILSLPAPRSFYFDVCIVDHWSGSKVCVINMWIPVHHCPGQCLGLLLICNSYHVICIPQSTDQGGSKEWLLDFWTTSAKFYWLAMMAYGWWLHRTQNMRCEEQW